GREPAKPPQ
ncbi:exodeoxyribonuclease V alpha chain domain protein, partial [Vibrio cholerae HC-02C1]